MHRETSCTVIRDCMAEDAVGFYGILGDEETTAYLSNSASAGHRLVPHIQTGCAREGPDLQPRLVHAQEFWQAAGCALRQRDLHRIFGEPMNAVKRYDEKAGNAEGIRRRRFRNLHGSRVVRSRRMRANKDERALSDSGHSLSDG